jgi:hypothetical protein
MEQPAKRKWAAACGPRSVVGRFFVGEVPGGWAALLEFGELIGEDNELFFLCLQEQVLLVDSLAERLHRIVDEGEFDLQFGDTVRGVR